MRSFHPSTLRLKVVFVVPVVRVICAVFATGQALAQDSASRDQQARLRTADATLRKEPQRDGGGRESSAVAAQSHGIELSASTSGFYTSNAALSREDPTGDAYSETEVAGRYKRNFGEDWTLTLRVQFQKRTVN